MTPLFYILRKSFKNYTKTILKSPAKLILWILAIAAVAAVAVITLLTENTRTSTAPLFWFAGILFLFVTLFTITSVASGLSGGNAIFEMNDVNLLFISPVNPRKTLLYGIVKMAKSAFLAGFFILFQGASLANFGINYGGVLITFAGYIFSIMAAMSISMVIYSVTNSRPRRKLFVKIITAAFFSPLLVFAVIQYFIAGSLVTAIEAAVNSLCFKLIPVAGWTAAGVTALISGQIFTGLLWLFANVLLLGFMIGFILLSNPDYYEDVLVAAETVFEKKRAMEGGNVNSAMASQKSVKVRKTGIPGTGASAIFGKHLRESFRENRLGILTLSSIIIAAGAVVFAVIFKNISIVLYGLPWVQMFLIGTGRGLKETYSHYIYMIPEPSLNKIIWSNMEIFARTLIENTLIFGISGIILRTPIVLILACIIVYTLFSYLLLAVNYVLMRFTGIDVSAGLMLIIYFAAIILAAAPGLVLAVIAAIIVGGKGALLIGLLVMSAWELVAGTVGFIIARGVLHNCDMATIRTS